MKRTFEFTIKVRVEAASLGRARHVASEAASELLKNQHGLAAVMLSGEREVKS